MQGKAFSVNGLIYSLRINRGNISVGDKDVSKNASANRAIFNLFFSLITNQIAAPVMAIT